ncbi:arginine--tRNA ligase [Candidatus Peregrinibacteria bacterium]|nr:arginine--tRNA ligase [Candidatus Peregrinibacteria bacterium]
MKKRNLSALREGLREAIEKAGMDVPSGGIHIEKSKTPGFGHFAVNIAMSLAGREKGDPRAIAEKIKAHLDPVLFEKVEIAGPGFINLWVEQKFYSTECADLAADLEKYLSGVFEIQKKKPIMLLDTSHPNIAKPMGVHHLLSTIIGDAVKKIYKRFGYQVVNDNYLGDWGTQFGKLIYAIRQWGDMKLIGKNPIPELLNLYVKFHNEAEKDPGLEDFGRAEFKKLEKGDSENRKLWEFIVAKSMVEFQKIYDRLHVEFDMINGESFYENKMPAILEYGRKKGIFIDGEQGAWIVPMENPDEPPAIVRKSDGSTLYATRDLARIKYWEDNWHPELMVNVVDVAQELYFKQLFEVTDKLGLTKAKNVHVKFGRMQFEDGKMSTRKGNIILLEEVLDESEDRAMKLAEEKGIELSADERKELARIMGVGAIKYNVLSQNRTTNITFNWDKMLTFEGNSAPYLMYTAARAHSVIRKAETDAKEAAKYTLELKEPAETQLAIELLLYADSIRRAAQEFKPNLIANYLYELAQEFNVFYNNLPILQADSEELKKSRLLLTVCVLKIMEDGLGLLGIEVPEKM